jgi:hypothetical protein
VPARAEHGKHYDAREADEELLAGLAEDLDLRGFLPPGPVEPGAQWALSAEAIASALMHGGDLAIE